MSKSPRRANLTCERTVRALKWQVGDPPQFEVKDIDHHGYYLRLSRGGAKTWLYRYKLKGQLRRVNMGRYPFIDCLAAFNAYYEAWTQVIGGIDIALQLANEKEAVQIQEQVDALTLSTLFHDHYYRRFASLKRSMRNDWHYFTVKIEPLLGRRPAIEVTPEDIERLIRPIEVKGYNTGRLTLALLRKMFNWAMNPTSAEQLGEGALISSDHANPCNHYELNRSNKPPPIDRYLRDSEIRLIWNKLGDDNSSRILKLQLLTGCRVGEVCGMREEEIDRGSMEWILPSSRVKTTRPHLVPLTSTLLELIGEPKSAHVFATSSKCGHTPYFTVSQRLKRLCNSLSLTNVSTHTMRRTFITHMARMGVPIDVRNRLTNHADHSIDGVYNQHDYLSEKRSALIMWDARITNIVS